MEESERLRQLCEQASVEWDSKKLVELTDQIIALFEKRDLERRSTRQPQGP
jgi:hypothetical protein